MIYSGLKRKKKMQIWEKESKDIFKVKNPRICSAMIKKHTRVHFAQSKRCSWARTETLQTKQNFVAERVETLHFAVLTNQNLVAGQEV